MKKILLGTSALLVAGFMAASANAAPIKLSVGGYANWYTGYVGGNNAYENRNTYNQVPVVGDVEISFKGETALQNGVKFGTVVEVEGVSGAVGQMNEDQSYIYVDSAFGRVLLGKMDSMSKQFHTASKDVGLLGIQASDMSMLAPGVGGFNNYGFTGLSTDVRDNDDAASIAYVSPKWNGLTVAASYSDMSFDATSNEEGNDAMYMGVVAYENTFGGVDLSADLAYAKYDASNEPVDGDLNGVSVNADYAIVAGLRLGYEGFTVGGGYKFVEARLPGTGDYSAFDMGVAYETGPYGVSLSYIYGKQETNVADMKESLLLASASYNVTAGVDTFASFGYATNEVTTKQKAYVFATGLGLSF